jgi:hypothetical protein
MDIIFTFANCSTFTLVQAAADRVDSKQIKPFLKTQVSALDNICFETERLSEVLLKFLYLHFLSNKLLLLLLQSK